MPVFKTKRGRLTPYALACGYIEQKSDNPSELADNDLETELYHDGGCYHVRQFNWREGRRVFWESFPTLTEARKLFDKQTGKRIK